MMSDPEFGFEDYEQHDRELAHAIEEDAEREMFEDYDDTLLKNIGDK